MKRFERVRGKVVPLVRDNIDTDQIVPKQFLKRVGRRGFEDALFFDWRSEEEAAGRKFVLDDPRYAGAPILLTGENFGCGSSREHAVWALIDSGIRVVVAASFSDIFRSNALKNGLLAVAVGKETVRAWAGKAAATEPAEADVDLESQSISFGDAPRMGFDIGPHAKRCLLQGLDEIEITLQSEKSIEEYERALVGTWRGVPQEPDNAPR